MKDKDMKKSEQGKTAEPHFYLVGGAVRDRLLGLTVTDRDWVVVGATPEYMMSNGFKPVGKDFPVFIHPRTGEEYALARTERKTAQGHGGFIFYCATDVTLEADLQRRDLTINALAEDVNGQLIDLIGGQADLKKRCLRHVSAAFTEDPLRVLRTARFLARFASLGFRIAPETQELMRSMTQNGELSTLSPERVWQETRQALTYSAAATYFQTLLDLGALQVLSPLLAKHLQPASRSPLPTTHTTNTTDTTNTLTVSTCNPHHAEHPLTALARAASANASAPARFACLTHGLCAHQRLHTLATAWRIPKLYCELTQICHQLYRLTANVLVHPDHLNADTLLTLFEQTDAWRRSDRFTCALETLPYLWRHTVHTEIQSIQSLVTTGLHAAQRVSAQTVIAASPPGNPAPRGADLGAAIRAQRQHAIQQALF
ncbi:MAG: multifunctional CCA tRNA nucleotidyl transferase/2'3'-cyclic phosphodiesterase/2'nucleotidase/phosphatase [Gammaproteobacteria bacterium]